MHWLQGLVLALSCFAATSLSLPSSQVDIRSSAKPLAPSVDPWYTAPDGFEKATPGSVLRIRPAPGDLTAVVANTSAAYNILYRTTDSNYKPWWGVTTLFVPAANVSQTSSASCPSLLSVQFAYNTADVDSSPSYALYGTFAEPALGAPPSTYDISESLGNGWYVTTPDFEGPGANFALGVQEGHAVLDSIRAVLSSKVIPNAKSAKYAMWGYSGGSLASAWASELQEQYAPELHFSGAAIGGIVPNLTNSLDNLTSTAYAGLIPPALLGITGQDEEAHQWLLSRLKQSGPYNASYFLKALNMDVTGDFATYAYQNAYEYFIEGRADVVAPVMQKLFNRNAYLGYHGVPQFPVFVYKSVLDEFSQVQWTDALIERWCGIGVPVWYQRNTVGGHIAEIVNGRGRALAWLKTVFDGTYQADGCLIQNVTVAISTTPDV